MSTGGPDVRFGIVGLEHPHVFTLVDGLVGAGARPVAHSMQGSLVDPYAAWQTTSAARPDDAIIDDDDLDLIVCVGEPASRATTAAAALRAGRHVLCDKPAVTSPAQLELITAAVAASGRRWWVLFSERFTNRAVTEAVRRAGADHLIAVDDEAVRRIDCSTVALDWADRVVADIVDGTDTLMSAAATIRVCRLAIEAQERARPWPAPARE